MDTLQPHEEAFLIYKMVYPEFFNENTMRPIFTLDCNINQKEQFLDDINKAFKDLQWGVKAYYLENSTYKTGKTSTRVYYSGWDLNGWDWSIVLKVIVNKNKATDAEWREGNNFIQYFNFLLEEIQRIYK